MARSGLSALRVRIVLKAWIPPAPQSEAMKLMRDTYFDRKGCVMNNRKGSRRVGIQVWVIIADSNTFEEIVMCYPKIIMNNYYLLLVSRKIK